MLPTNYRGASSVRFVPADFQPTAEQLAIQRCQNRYVIAMSAAGSGKSTTIALKVMENVRYGKDPRKILVLTFSREAAQVIRRMIAKLSNDAQLANAIRCIAFDDFCVEVLNGFGYERADQLSSMDEVCAYVRKAAANIKKREDDRVRPLEIVLPEHNEQIAEFVRNARLMKANLLSPDLDEDETYEDRAIRYGLPESFFYIYREVERVRGTGSYYDDRPAAWRSEFDATFDLARMLIETQGRIRMPTYEFVAVDELQDMNPASYEVLKWLLDPSRESVEGSIAAEILGPKPVYFIGAGDFDQIIHGWAGSNIRFMKECFGAEWPSSSVVRLTLSSTYRHGPIMAKMVSALMGDGSDNERVRSGRSHKTEVRVERYADHGVAAGKLVAALVDFRKRGGRLDDTAIILRSPYQSILVENALFEAGLNWRIEGMESYLMRPEVLALRGIMAFALDDLTTIPGDNKFSRVISSLLLWQQFEWAPERLQGKYLKDAAKDPGLNFQHFLQGVLLRPRTIYDRRVARLSWERQSMEETALLERIQALNRSGQTAKAEDLRRRSDYESSTVEETPEERRNRLRLDASVALIRGAAPDAPAHVLLEQVVATLDMKNKARLLFVDPAMARMVSQSLDGFVQSAKRRNCSLREFANWLKDVDIALRKARPMNTLLVCSVEAAKGQEFEAVLLPFLEAGAFPARDADPHEERNRFYVAVTRVCDELTLLVPEDEQRVSPYVKSLKVARSLREGGFLDRCSDDNR